MFLDDYLQVLQAYLQLFPSCVKVIHISTNSTTTLSQMSHGDSK